MRYGKIVALFRWGLALGTLGGAVVAGLFAYEFFRAPRMRVQPHLRAFEAIMPLPPPGAVPLPTPLPPSAAGSAPRGKVYYGYYCLACHGEKGDGHGPVGQSYMPVPADLRSEKFRSYDDARLLRASLAGTGHAPVLERVVPPGHRPHLIAYLRTLARDGQERLDESQTGGTLYEKIEHPPK